MTKLIHSTTLRPHYDYSTKEILAAAQKYWLNDCDERVARIASKLINGAEIQSRGSIVPLEVVFSDLSFEEKNNLYKEAMIDMGQRVLAKALEESGIKPQELDFLITTSCTGFMIPSVDAYMVDRLKLRKDIIRLPVTEMGCAGGTSGLIYANEFLKSNPGKKVALVSIETPSITFLKNDHSMENLVSTAIFADGASCVILGETPQVKPKIIDTSMYHFGESTHLMGYNLQNEGLKIVLDKSVPNEISHHFNHFFNQFLEKNKLSPQEVDHFIFHPGGKKIIHLVEDEIKKYGKNVDTSKQILNTFGNMSSSTVLYILHEFMQQDNPTDTKGYMLAFGPGFMAQNILLKWE